MFASIDLPGHPSLVIVVKVDGRVPGSHCGRLFIWLLGFKWGVLLKKECREDEILFVLVAGFVCLFPSSSEETPEQISENVICN